MFSFCVKNPKDIWTAYYTQFTVRSVHTEAAAAMLCYAMLGQQVSAAAAAATAVAMLGQQVAAVAAVAMLGQQ